MWMVQYKQGMWIYKVATNYILLRDNDKIKGGSMYTDRRPKESGNIVGFINNTHLRQQIRNPISYLRGMKETMFSYVQ